MSEPKTIYLKDYQAYPFIVNHVELSIELGEQETKVSARLDVSRKTDAALDAPFDLNGEALQLEHIAIDGKALSESDYQLVDNVLTLADVPQHFILETHVTIFPKQNTSLMGLYWSGGNYCTQCESHGFRKITFFPDRPDVMTLFTVTITADQKQFPYLLSNGNLIKEEALDGGRHRATWQDPSLKPCYLFALVAGDFDLLEDKFITMSGRNVDLKLFVEKGKLSQAPFAMAALKRSMKWDEDVYGREYDLDIFMTVAVSDFNFGAMENKGLNIFNTKFILAKPETATDKDYTLIEGVVGHEYFHNWSGDRVTCRDWFQITLKEGFTVFRDQNFTADMTSPAVERIDAVDIIRNMQFRQDAGPMAHPIRPESYIEVNNFYTVTVYNKGAEIIRMMYTLLGKKTFRQATDLYFDRFDGQAVTTDDFVACMEEASGLDLTQFKRWYWQAGTPVLTITDTYDANQQRYTLHVQQSCPETADGSAKDAFFIPLSVALLDPSGNDMPGSAQVLHVTEKEQDFIFEGIKEQPIPSLLRNFSAPIKCHYDYSDEQLAWLMVNDNDAFNRWDAAGRLALNIFMSHYKHQAQSVDVPQVFIDAMRYVLQNEPDHHLAALTLKLPSENYLQQQVSDADPMRIHQLRASFASVLADALHQDLLQRYQALVDDADYVYNAQAMGRRALKNQCLAYLTLTHQEMHDLAYQQFNQANNMTDKMAALGALNDIDCMQREAALLAFYEEWQQEELVMDKWFALQGGSNLPGTLAKVKTLLQHPAYSGKNPNKIRALVGSFSNNSIMFHLEDGSGYNFLAEQVIATDQLNPMTAARLVEPLIRWQNFNAPRQKHMQAALKMIMDAKPSNDLFEVVSRALKGV